MNRSDLIRKVSRQARSPQPQTEELLDLMLGMIENALASGDTVVIKNFGKFEVRERAPTIRRNPRTGVDIKVPRKRALLFHPAPALKKNIQCDGGDDVVPES